jgi:multidrug resistance efflux pump
VRPRRHRPPRRAVAAVALVLALAAGLAALVLGGRLGGPPGPLTASGTIEVDEVTLAAELPARISDLSVDEGSSVTSGQVLGHLRDPVLDVQLKQSVGDAAQYQLQQAQLQKLELHAPLDGVVQKRLVHAGEFVGTGTPIFTIADPTDLKLTLFVREVDLGRVSVGQRVDIHADPFPDRTFEGHVTAIADKAEFTPRNVQTQRDRQNLVFAVTVRVPNPDRALKSGLPVDATFLP